MLKESTVIDCKEQGVVKSTRPIIEDASNSGKYLMNTISDLIGCCPKTGHVYFVFDCAVGAKNDQNIFNLINWNKHLPGKWILADMGFTGPSFVSKHKKYRGFKLTHAKKRK